MPKKRNMANEVFGSSEHQRAVLAGIAETSITEMAEEWDETGRNKLGYYRTIEEYYAANKHKKYNFGDAFLPRLYFKKKASVSVRRGAFIHAYVGPNGGGKSLAMVHDTLATLNGIEYTCSVQSHRHPHENFRGYRRVLSSVPLVDPRTGQPHPLWIPFNDHRKLFLAYHTDILMDEVTGLASQDESFQLPIQIKNMLAQLRRRDCFLRWTTPNWTTAAKAVRNVTRAVTYCKGYLPVFEEGKSWPSNCWFSWKTYDAQNFEYFNVGTRDRLTPITFQFYLRTNAPNIADEVYDTGDDVLTAGATNDAGMCMHCGGKRNLPTCRCDRDEVDSEQNLIALSEALYRNEFAAAGAPEASGSESPEAHAAHDDTEKGSTYGIEAPPLLVSPLGSSRNSLAM